MAHNEYMDSNLLLQTLRLIWHNYANAAEDGNAEAKHHWLQLFLFYFRFVDGELDQSDEFKNFMNLVPEEICSNLLEQVYEIISKSDLFTPTQSLDFNSTETAGNKSTSKSSKNRSKSNIKLLRKKHNFAQLILSAPSDCSKILALRTFLTHQLGQHLLEFLLKVDIKLIASQNSLCNLCINLFPNCSWGDNQMELHKFTSIFAYVGHLNFYQTTKSKKNFIVSATEQKSPTDELSSRARGVLQNSRESLQNFPLSLMKFVEASRTSDEIAHMLIELLKKCVVNECSTTLTEHALSVIALNFALDALRMHNDAFVCRQNEEVIKLELLQLSEQCLNNIFANAENMATIQFQCVFAKLGAALESNRITATAPIENSNSNSPNTNNNSSSSSNSNNISNNTSGDNVYTTINSDLDDEVCVKDASSVQILHALLFTIFGILYNVVTIYSSSNPNIRQNLYEIKLFEESLIVDGIGVFKKLLRQDVKLQRGELCSLFASTFKTLLKIIDSLCLYEQLTAHTTATSSGIIVGGANYITQSKPRRRKINVRQMHCHDLQPPMSSCFFQEHLLNLLPLLGTELQEYAVRYLLRSGTCCCHYTLDTYAMLLQVTVHLGATYKKYAYKFLCSKILNAIYGRDSSVQNKRHALHCMKCDVKLKSNEFHAGLLELYRRLYAQEFAVVEHNTLSLQLFLKHLKHIAHLVTNNVATGILAQIVLPIFRNYKFKTKNNKQNAEILVDSNSSSPISPQSPSLESAKLNNTQASIEHPTRLHFHTSSVSAITTTTTINTSKEQSHLDIHTGFLKILNECLNIFVAYLSDIRLIKAFYNEENIKYLEELLNEPELISRVCDLIRIGIDNITFLGDNSLEQTALSRRLITLQLNSSDRAAQLFNALLQRFSKCCKTAKSNFWMDGQTVAQQSSSLSPLDILNITALQWTLNYELLKTSQFFYNEFAKIYSIVLEEDESDEITETVGKPKETITRKEYLQHGDKTIVDILKLNYNALTCFLIEPHNLASHQPAKHNDDQEQQAPSHIYTFEPSAALNHNQCATAKMSSSNSTHKEIDCFSSSLETLFSNTDFRTTQIEFLQHLVSASTTATTSGTTATVTATIASTAATDEDYNYDRITQLYVDDTNSTFLHKLKQRQGKQLFEEEPIQESIVLFDIRNQIQVKSLQGISSLSVSSTETVNSNSSSWSVIASSPFNSTGVTLSTVLADSKTLGDTPQSKEGLVAKLFGMFGSLFSGGLTNSVFSLSASDKKSPSERNHQETADTIDRDLLCIFATHGDGKKLLLKLFESTMAICLKGYQNEEMEKMQKHLRKLKAIILSSASTQKQQHVDEHVRENSVLQTLQTLLKIAELSSTLNSSAAVGFNADSDTLVAADDVEGCLAAASASTSSNVAMVGPAQRHRTRSLQSTHTQGFPSHLIPPKSTQATAISTPATTPRRPLSGDSAHTNGFFSTRASIICADSEFEFSENEQDDYYLTADEGYEADAEVPEITDSEVNPVVADLWNSFQPTSRYRTHVLHEGLSRLVVEILMELSHICALNPDNWCDNLVQLASRLFVIREYLGGPLFLLRGFAPVLSCNDVRLQELQQAILELIVDINTPDVLCTFLSILAAKNPPAEILMRHMNYICGTSLKKAQPSVELEFPVLIDGKCVSTSDIAATEQIERVRNYHLHCQANTPFTRAPCIIPLTHARLWNNDGVTLSLWMQVKGGQRHKSLSQLNEDDARSSTEDYMKAHIVSFGTNQAMLSIYINSNMNLVFETCKPNAEMQTRSPLVSEVTACEVFHSNNANATEVKASPKGSQDAPTSFSTAITAASPLRNALKQTKLVLLNSFSNIHLFQGHTDGASYFEGAFVDLKNFRLPKNKWVHLTFAVEAQTDRLDVIVYVNGLEQHLISLPFRNLRNLIRTHAFQLISLGDGLVPKSPNNSACNYTGSRSTLEAHPLRYSISNVLLFNRKIISCEPISHLTAMGPDFSELTQCQVGNWKPNYGFLNLSKTNSANFGNFSTSMKFLKQAHILTYSAQQPEMVMGFYSTITESYNVPSGKPYGLILYGELIQNELQSLQTATILSGGLSTLLYLFARIVEISNDSSTQAKALDLFLNISLSDSQLYAEFVRNDYINLIGYVIRTERCTKDAHLLRSITNNACSHELISKKGDTLLVNDSTNASLVYPRLITSVLHRFSDWHRSGAEQSDVLDMLLQCVLALTREKHPHRDFNIEQLNNTGFVRELLNLCKVYVIESPNPIHISSNAACSFVQILSVFAGSPPSTSLMDEIMKLLLLLHKPSECYVTHDRAYFYFLLTTQLPIKEKSIGAASLSRVAAPFRRSERPGVAEPVSPTSSETVEEVGRAARIERLRRLHTINSTYRRPLHEFEDNLERVADCSKLNKNALRLLNPFEVKKWRNKFKRSSIFSLPNISKQTHSSRTRKSTAQLLPPITQQKIARKRLLLHSATSARSALWRDGEKCLRRTDRCSDGSLQTLTASVAAALNANFVGNPSEVNEIFGSSTLQQQRQPHLQRRSKSLIRNDFYHSAGIIALQESLLLLLKDFLCLLPDNVIEDVLKHYVKVEFLLVLANHSSCAVRAAIIKLLAALTRRLSTNDLLACVKSFYPQHLANQLAMATTDAHMFEACIEWVTGAYGNLDTILHNDVLRIHNRFGLNALVAVASKTTLHLSDCAEKAFKVLRNLYISDTEEHHTLIEAGMIQCCVKALYYFHTKSNMIHMKTENSILELLTIIGERSLKSVGHINIVWDILNMLSFYQEKQPMSIVKAFRSVQAKLQLNWLHMFFGHTHFSSHFKVSVPVDGSLTLSETRTRLDLLIDRCSQFFTIFDSNYSPSDNEIELFELLVSYGIKTNQRCNNFIAWGLLPSRPHALRAFIVNALWTSCQDDFLPSIICDGKMIKSLLCLCLWQDLDEPIENLDHLCKRLGISEKDSIANVDNELGRINLNLCSISAKQKSILEKTVYKFEPLAVSCIESSMVLTRRVAELQNAERKLIMSQMKDYDETYSYTKWLEIIRRQTHEGAPWYSNERAENSWELDDTEGPSRVHTRLRRCHLDIDKRFFMEDYGDTCNASENITPLKNSAIANARCVDEYVRPLDYLISSYDQQLNIALNSQILYNFPAIYLPVDGEIDGEIIVTDHKIYFLATYRCKYFYVSCDISNITEIWLKRYQHQEKALEIFLDTNQSLFFSLHNQSDWKLMRDVFCDKIVTPPDQSKLALISQQWREGLLTNWEYLMTLNQISGRTYNDLMQYPVFPWILSNYKDDVLDLTNPQYFRKLDKPIAVQHEENEQHYISNYNYINSTMTNIGSLTLKPYHYSSHYSNSGTVLHFLVRVPPFTSYFLRYQDNNFDLPDRTFHALSTTWSLASRDSPTDVKELIPEFFSLPELFENFERFNFGCRQSGERVEDVSLPPWARDPRLFVLIHRQALESELVRSNLHQWIDLIFGYKQTGESAVEAINVFHPATYAVFLESEIADPIERKAVETMVKTYGQMPRQLFKSPHGASKMLNYNLDDKEIVHNIRGLRWGVYLGSPQLPQPMLGNIYKLPDAEQLISFNSTNVVYALPAKACVMQGAEVDTFNVIYWGCIDRIVRIQPLNKAQSKCRNLLHNSAFDEITACGAEPNSNQLWFGHKSGRISIYKCVNSEANNRTPKPRQSYVRGLRLSYNSAFRKITTKSGSASGVSSGVKSDLDIDGDGGAASIATHATTGENQHRDGADLSWSGSTVLVRHTDAITCISLSVEFKIAVTAGRDGIAVIWDLNNWSYVRTIERPAEIHHSPITIVVVSPTLGDIVTVHTIPQQQNDSRADNSDENQSDNLNEKSSLRAVHLADECFEVTEENLDDFVNVSINPNGKSILRLHTVNARYVQHIVHEDRILAACYSYIKEGVGVNVIATAVEGGIVRLWSSWNLSFVREIITGISNIKSITYSTHQHLVVLTKESRIQVWETEGLCGSAPKFPQIAYK